MIILCWLLTVSITADIVYRLRVVSVVVVVLPRTCVLCLRSYTDGRNVLYWRKKQLPTCSKSHLPHSHSYTTGLLYATRIQLLYNSHTPVKFVLQRNCTHSVTYLLILLLLLTVLHSSYTRRQSRVQLKQDAPQQIHFRLVSFDRIKRARARCSLFNLEFVICNLFDFIYFPFWIGLSYNRIGIYGIYFLCCCCLYSFFALCNLAESHQSVSSCCSCLGRVIYISVLSSQDSKKN